MRGDRDKKRAQKIAMSSRIHADKFRQLHLALLLCGNIKGHHRKQELSVRITGLVSLKNCRILGVAS